MAFFDYIVGSSTIIAIGVYLSQEHEPLLIIPFTLVAGLSRAFQNILVDQRRHFYTKSASFENDAFCARSPEPVETSASVSRTKRASAGKKSSCAAA